MMMTGLIVAILMAVLYVGAAIKVRGELPASLSALVYVLPEGGWRWLWTVWIWLTGLLIVGPLLEVLPECWEFLGALMVASLMFCGAMPLFVRELNRWHNGLGVAVGVLSQLCVLIVSPWWLMVWLLMAAVAIGLIAFPHQCRWTDGKGVMIAEMVCTVTVCGSLLVRLAEIY